MASEVVRNRPARRREAAMLAVAEAALVAVFWPVLFLMGHELWRSGAFSQNLLLPVVAAVALYARRRDVAAVEWRRDWRGAAVCAVALCGYAAGVRFEMFTVARVGAIAAMVGCAMFFTGAAFVGRAWGAVALVFLMAPPPEYVQAALLEPWVKFDRSVTSAAAIFLARAAGTDAWRDGMYIYVTAGRLSMDVRCAGMNYILNLCVITLLIVYVTRGEWRRKALLALLAPAVGFAANVLRVAVNVVVGDRLGTPAGFAFFHNAGGILFALAAALMMAVAARLCGLRLADEKEQEDEGR